jgi:hypothetical protein
MGWSGRPKYQPSHFVGIRESILLGDEATKASTTDDCLFVTREMLA